MTRVIVEAKASYDCHLQCSLYGVDWFMNYAFLLFVPVGINLDVRMLIWVSFYMCDSSSVWCADQSLRLLGTFTHCTLYYVYLQFSYISCDFIRLLVSVLYLFFVIASIINWLHVILLSVCVVVWHIVRPFYMNSRTQLFSLTLLYKLVMCIRNGV